MIHPQFTFHNGATPHTLGYVPLFFDLRDPRSATQQVKANYVGGWHPLPGLRPSNDFATLNYPGDPPMRLLATAKFRDEYLRLYEGEWLAITQSDGSTNISRVD